ncbi:hypothetical protein FACS1894166_03900 [Bacilli bacterium]|nr:hypothetical protein FACS1894166_03900 [Bacilli bacterium]
MLAQGIDHGETNTGSKLIVASAITSALAFATSIIAIMCGFKINHTTAGKHDERIYQFTVVAFVFAIASLIMITCMASAVNSDA